MLYCVLGYHNDPIGNHNTNNTLNTLVLILMSISILVSGLMVYYYNKYYTQSSKLALPNVNELSNFKVIKPYVTLHIHRTQAQFILDELINEAKRTKIFTIVPKTKSAHLNYMLIYVELVQDTQTIIALIECCPVTDEHLYYFYILRRFFRILFESSKTIHTWGNVIEQLRPYTTYGLFSLKEVVQRQSVNMQKEFKVWYNHTFRHHTQCQRYLKYDHMDGPSCSCSHRPYKSSSDQWSTKRAMAYTFDEQLNNYFSRIHQCLAITKLTYVVNEKWNIRQLKDYKQQHHNNENVSV